MILENNGFFMIPDDEEGYLLIEVLEGEIVDTIPILEDNEEDAMEEARQYLGNDEIEITYRQYLDDDSDDAYYDSDYEEDFRASLKFEEAPMDEYGRYIDPDEIDEFEGAYIEPEDEDDDEDDDEEKDKDKKEDDEKKGEDKDEDDDDDEDQEEEPMTEEEKEDWESYAEYWADPSHG